MITFLPSADFTEVARLLDDKRLGGQRTEAWSILKWLRSPDAYPKLVRAGYCLMWKGHEEALAQYLNAMLVEWARRGKKNDLLQPFDSARGLHERPNATMPPWLGCEALHAYHRSALLAKLPEHYAQFGWRERADVYTGSYPWPVMDPDTKTWHLRWPKSAKRPAEPIVMETTTESTRKRKRAQPPASASSLKTAPTVAAKPGPLCGKVISPDEQAARPMSRVLTFGRKQAPRAIVVLIHGLSDSADGWHGSFAGRWARAMPGVLVVVPQSPDECGAYSPDQRGSGWSQPGDRKYDWLSQAGVGVVKSDRRACIRTLQQVTEMRVRQLDRWLDSLLATHSLSAREMVLVGFSQGSILAAVCGTRRRCRGVVAVGGVPGQPFYDATVDDYVGGAWYSTRTCLPPPPPSPPSLSLRMAHVRRRCLLSARKPTSRVRCPHTDRGPTVARALRYPVRLESSVQVRLGAACRCKGRCSSHQLLPGEWHRGQLCGPAQERADAGSAGGRLLALGGGPGARFPRVVVRRGPRPNQAHALAR